MLNKYLSLLFIVALLLLAGCSTTPETGSADNNIKYNPDYTQALAAMKSGELKEAQLLLRKVIKQQPKFSNAHVNMGIIYFKRNSLTEAENSFQYALKINPENMYAFNHLGLLYRHQGKFSAAKTAYEKAIDIDSNYAYAQLNLGILFDLYLYDFSSAIEQYKKYQDILGKDDKQVNKWIIDLERRLKKSQGKK